MELEGINMPISSIGYATSVNGIAFSDRRQIIKPEFDWERYGCEDPRITFCNGKYYIFYTALSTYPFSANGIRIGLAITKDFKTFEKHPVTGFNSKAMAMFPEKINNKYAAILTVHTDLPPAKIALALFDREEDLWNEAFWINWYSNLNQHIISLLRDSNDHLEVGAQPIKTDKGWLMIFSYIENYFTDTKHFKIEAALLDMENPLKIIGRTEEPLLFPEKEYELHGEVSNITFPSGAVLDNKNIYLYYGAADTFSCLAIGDAQTLIEKLSLNEPIQFNESKWIRQGFHRYHRNPIISPRPEFEWEAMATFNPAVIYEDNKFHIVYRAMSFEMTSVFGYASSSDGVHIDERLPNPIYEPTANFERKLRPGNSGCEDPRLTLIDNELYMFYTAFDGYTPRVAFTSISIADFINRHWNWKSPKVITPPNIPDKDACVLSKKIKGKFMLFHRMNDFICLNAADDLNFEGDRWLNDSTAIIKPRKSYWDNSKFGIAGPPIEIKQGWLMLYHRATLPSPSVYKVEAALLDLQDPSIVLAQTDATLLEPETCYEEKGIVPNVVFPCGAVLLNGMIHLYYGGGDRVVAVARMELKNILKRFGICE
ncbi:hypothetical protein SanaruYs_06170 [Chryseotalea sanaruensis]|uniref:Glycosidase n=2 Tax=Chryseotalea sanaruensis TaxID=2482724 RepID=A0A401U6C1_9BACT|nr:hypothetical protein SanaruYs_06170 [Chryseotalea sanaruensis]